MKKTIFIFSLLFTVLSASAADYSLWERSLQNSLTFSGDVEVTSVAEQSNGTQFVIFEVTSYGEMRDSWCVMEGRDILQCMDNWFARN